MGVYSEEEEKKKEREGKNILFSVIARQLASTAVEEVKLAIAQSTQLQ